MIEVKTTLMYFSWAANRYYRTKRAAIDAETRALIKRKYPDEKADDPDHNTGYYYPGWNWTMLPRSNVLYRRLRRIVKRSAA